MIAEPGGLVVAHALLARGAAFASWRATTRISPRNEDASSDPRADPIPSESSSTPRRETPRTRSTRRRSPSAGWTTTRSLDRTRCFFPLLPRFSCWCPRSTPDLFARRGARSPSAWARRAVATDGDGGRVVALMDATRGADAAASAAAAEFAGDGRAVETLRATTHESRRRRYALVTLAVRDARA